MDKQQGISILVKGSVQGVFYRASTQQEAQKLGLKGWVKNLPNGNVQIEAFGLPSDLDVLSAWCKQGPPMSKVTGIEIKKIEYRLEDFFRIVY